jgi:hypothetical protein
MKRSILISCCALMLLCCKKDNYEPTVFRMFTRTPVLLGNTTYMLKGTIVAESSLEVVEYGFLYTQNTSPNNNFPAYNSASTNRANILFSGKIPPGNFETQTLLVSGQFYYITAFVKVYDPKNARDEVYTGSQVLFKIP